MKLYFKYEANRDKDSRLTIASISICDAEGNKILHKNFNKETEDYNILICHKGDNYWARHCFFYIKKYGSLTYINDKSETQGFNLATVDNLIEQWEIGESENIAMIMPYLSDNVVEFDENGELIDG